MKNTQSSLVVRASVLAVRGALAALAMMPVAYAADTENEETRELTRPVSTVEVGVGTVSDSSAKFGEYNGLNQSGAYGIGAFNLRGGGAYDSDSAFRWSATGTDLGLHTRRLDTEVGEQGKYRLTYGYDELLRNYSDDYQTFYNGAGSNAMTLPSTFVTPAAARLTGTATAAAALSNWQNLQSPYATAACATTGGVPTAACRGPGYLIPAAMHNFNVDTQRTKHNLGLNMVLAPGWEFTASAQREDKDGSKLTGVAFGGPARGVMAVEPVNSTTDQYRASVGYIGEKGHFSVGYYGSFYRNATNAWTVENPFNGALLNSAFNNTARLTGAPDNEMHRLSLSGGYNFSKTTRLTLAGNYQRMTQNETLLGGMPSNWTIPTASANAKVINTSLTANLSSRPMKDVTLGAVYKYENRDDKSPIYNFLVSGGDAATAPSLFTTEPLNRRMQQINLNSDYAFANRQSVNLGYELQEIRRTADGAETPFRAETTRENTLRLGYRNNLSQIVTGRVSYARSQRRASEYEENELLPVPNPAPLPAVDPLLPGFRQFYLADRNRDQLRSALNFQASDALSFQTGIDYNKDNYTNSPYGLKSSDSWVLKLDGAYSASETLSFNAFYTYEDKKSQLDSLVIGRGTTVTIIDAPAHAPGAACTGYFAAAGHLPSDEGTDICRQWTESQSDRVHTFGVGAKAAKLMNGKLDLSFDMAYSRTRTPIEVSGGAYFGNGATAAGATNNIWLAAQSFPDITSNIIDLRLGAVYKIDKASSVRVNYLYRRLRSADWQYDAYTNSAQGVLAVPTFAGTGMTSPNYSVQAIGVSYVYTF